MTIGWIYMCLAIILGLAGATCIKLSHGLTELVPSIMVFVFYAGCIILFAVALKKINLALAYAIWSGVGTAGITLIGIMWLHEELSWGKVVGIALIAIGVVSLNLTNVTEKQLADQQSESEKDTAVDEYKSNRKLCWAGFI
ncbi:MAG: multidrug efflux SMR transporter [Hormoscilla sp. GUM202]|nr:multidrug efflux SMR transporter [Hormoscilla sp. GM7CHS1pb]MBO1351405.1 multidrug efflux SMR transporter [Hormoscilla sp. GUM202]